MATLDILEANPGGDVSLGQYIRDRRVALDLTKSEAARRAGVSRRTWHEVEEGQRETSMAVTLNQFDQALQLPEGTLYAMTARSASRQAEALRARAVELVHLMTTDELEFFVESHGHQSVRDMFDQLRADIAELRDAQQALPPRRPDGGPRRHSR
jgi:transcriptional regulator with XRE-family HTH domain